MTPQRLNAGIQNELRLLEAQGVLTEALRLELAARYPVAPWNALVLARWFTLLGAASMGAGVVVLLRHLGPAVRLAEAGTAAGLALFLLGGHLLRRRSYPKAAAALELLAGFCLQGLTTALAIDFSSGSDNWPALVGVNAALLLLLAYLLRNRLVLIHALCNAFVFFGGETGYLSDWGAYWLGMDYPARFTAAGLCTLAIAWLHGTRLRGALQGFSRVYLHFGLLCLHFSLWFFALFGWFEKEVRWSGTEPERLFFSALWAAVCVGSLFLAGRLGQRALRSYGLVFLVIDVYTFYFQFVVANTSAAWFLHLLLTGGSLIATGFWLEKQLRTQGERPGPQQEAPPAAPPPA
jgi:hypothetical protein